MSTAYNFSFKVKLDGHLPPASREVLDYLLGCGGQKPKVLPDHMAFKHGLNMPQFKAQYEDFPQGSYRCNSWEEKGRAGRHIDLYLPAQKFEGIYESCLPLASWLANISLSEGAVGSFQNADDSDFNPTLLFVSERELYLGNTNKAQSFLTGKTLSIG